MDMVKTMVECLENSAKKVDLDVKVAVAKALPGCLPFQAMWFT